MKILFWVPYPSEGASNRYRIEQYLPYLDAKNIKYTLHSFWSASAFEVLYKKGQHVKKIYFFLRGTILRFLDLLMIFKYDIVFIHRESCPLFGDFFETILNILRKPIIFDFDDAIFFPSSSKPNSFIERFKNTKKVFSIFKKSKRIIAGNRYLADFALAHNNSVDIIPTSIDTHRYFPKECKPKNLVVVGWIGSNTTVDFLKMMKPIFIRLLDRFKNLKFRIVGGELAIPEISNFIENKSWAREEEIDDLRSFDIGIMPMPDDIWTKGKCGFKAILYMSMGIPAVCSPVGVNTEIISDGLNGFLAASEDEWVQKLSLLVENEQLRERIGLAGRKTIEEKYSIEKNAPKFLEILEGVYR